MRIIRSDVHQEFFSTYSSTILFINSSASMPVAWARSRSRALLRGDIRSGLNFSGKAQEHSKQSRLQFLHIVLLKLLHSSQSG
jgi:hypothetical protein